MATVLTLAAGQRFAPLAPADAAALELLPIPAAWADDIAGEVRFIAANAPFRQAGQEHGLAPSPLIARLDARIATFLAGEDTRETFVWESDDVADGRHYRVTLSRESAEDRRCLVTLIDHTSEYRTEHSLRREMTTDSMTGLPNRAAFSTRLKAAIGQDCCGYAVLIIDLDRFSRVNACLGSGAGDELLTLVAHRVKRALRAHDVLGRTGGDEFAILLALENGQGDADQVAKRIRSALSMPFRLSDFEIRISCSIGIAFASPATTDAADLIRHAQFAAKRSKTSGVAEVYQTQALDQLRGTFAMETALRRALDAGQLRFTFQPICDLATGRVYAFEALARWTDETGREIPPNDFIPVAEETGLIVPLGRWAIRQAVRTLAEWDRRAGGDCGVKVAVNLSAIQFQRDCIATIVEEALAASGLAGNRLKLELTESALITDPDRLSATLAALKAQGITLAMDDFGTGYSNLAYLQKLPIDILKIDRSFVTGMLADRDKVAMVRAILSLAQALGMQTIAEGVETNELGQTLAALGCTYGQGFYYARPLEPDAAYALLCERNA